MSVEPLRAFERLECFRLRVVTGKGIDEDPVREVEYYVLADGTVISVYDPVLESKRTVAPR